MVRDHVTEGFEQQMEQFRLTLTDLFQKKFGGPVSDFISMVQFGNDSQGFRLVLCILPL